MKKVIVAIAIVASFGVLAHAGVEGKLEVGAGIYNVMPMSSDFKDTAKSGMGLNLYGDYKINDQFTAGLEIGYGFGQELKIDSSYDLMHTMIGLRGKFVKPMDFGSKKGKIYGILGLASYSWSLDPEIASAEETEMGFSLGAGIDMELNANWIAGFELRYHMVSIGDTDANFMSPALKVGYNF